MCVDLTKYNQAFLMRTVEETLRRFTKGSVLSNLNAYSGLHQIVLNLDIAKLTTYISPFSCVQTLSVCKSLASKYFKNLVDNKVSGIEGFKCLMENILVIGKDQVEHDQRVKQVLDRIGESGLTLNLEIEVFIFSHQVAILGQTTGIEGVSKDPSKVRAIIYSIFQT